MKRSWKLYILPTLFLLVLGAVLGVQVESAVSGTDTFKQLQKLEDAFVLIHRQYVDDVDAEMVARHAIEGMLEELDPHSVYFSADEVREVQESYRGSFGGIGIWFEASPEDTARVMSIISGGPSEAAGVMPGDRIIAISDTNAVGYDDRDIQNRLKGPIGTSVQMTVKRPGVPKPITFRLTRAQIPITSLDVAYMMDDDTGYIRVSRFAATTHQEFREALLALKSQGMERLVLDLRDNPGGVMEAAVRMADEMLGAGKKIVYTQSRNTEFNMEERSTGGGLLEEAPVIVLVSPSSASASEIVAGALQDHDRALIVGQRTFGKGLVQQPFPLSDGSMIQMTVSRYYTPSGRLIQTPYKNGNQKDYYEAKREGLTDAIFNPSEYRESIPDSLKFETTHGRTVFGGGGIMPDFVVTPDTVSLAQAIAYNGLDYLFIRDVFEDHEQALRDRWAERPVAFVEEYEVDDATWKEFLGFLEEQGLELSDDAKVADREANVYPRAAAEEGRAMVETRMKAYLVRLLYGAESSWPLFNLVDPTLEAALKLWPHANELAAVQSSNARLGDAGY